MDVLLLARDVHLLGKLAVSLDLYKLTYMAHIHGALLINGVYIILSNQRPSMSTWALNN